jgi:hypothetical protein
VIAIFRQVLFCYGIILDGRASKIENCLVKITNAGVKNNMKDLMI